MEKSSSIRAILRDPKCMICSQPVKNYHSVRDVSLQPMCHSHCVHRKLSKLPSVPLGTVQQSHTYLVWRLTSSRPILRNLLSYCLEEATVSPASLMSFGGTSSAAATEDTKVEKHPSWKNLTPKKTALKLRCKVMTRWKI